MSGPSSTWKNGRAYAEYLGGTKIKFYYDCGHMSVKDYSKGPVSKRVGEIGCKMMTSWWSKEKGGVTAPCPTCEREKRKR